MVAKKGFLLCAGFGTRFQPQSLHLPKPALPFLNLPQALFPAAALKTAGVEDFYYNSHHLPKELDKALTPFFNRSSVFEENILDSAGGIANAKSYLEDEEDFWVANGDSLVFLNDPEVLKDAFKFHKDKKALATLVGIKKPIDSLSGLDFSAKSEFTGVSKDSKALHFIGFYIFNKDIWSHLKAEKQHVFHDVLLKEAKDKSFVFDAEDRITWYETGNEKDFLQATKDRLLNLREKGAGSETYKSLEIWDSKASLNLEHFLKSKVWGHTYSPHKSIDDFLCIGESCSGDFSKLNNCVLAPGLNLDTKVEIKDQVLVNPTQWT